MRRTWTVKDERELVRLATKKDVSVEALAEKYNRSPAAIKKKLKRLGVDIAGLGVDVAAAQMALTGPLSVPKELPSLEEVLLKLAGALEKACQAGLGKTELQRLDTVASLYKAYAAGLEQYVGYRKIEVKLLDLEKKYAELAKKKK